MKCMATLKTQAIKLIYDAKGTLWARFRVPLAWRTAHANVVEKVLVRERTTTAYINDLEEKYYGSSAAVQFFHPRVYLYVLKNVWVSGSEGHVFFGPNSIFSACPSVNGLDPRKARRPIKWLSKKIDEPVFVLSNRAPGNRGHFLVEHLPRLLACRRILGNQERYKILVTPGHRTWQLGYLKKLGITSSDVVEGSFGSVFCTKVYVVPVLCEGKLATISIADDYRIIRDLFLADPRPSIKGFPMFVSRADARDRKLLNEDRIFDIAKIFFPGMKRVMLSKLSLDEQIPLFQNAPCIIGPHSQSFRNILFCENALVVQLLQGCRKPHNEYYHWANNYNALGIMNNNRCLSMFSQKRFNKNSNWEYPEDKLKGDLQRLMSVLGR